MIITLYVLHLEEFFLSIELFNKPDIRIKKILNIFRRRHTDMCVRCILHLHNFGNRKAIKSVNVWDKIGFNHDKKCSFIIGQIKTWHDLKHSKKRFKMQTFFRPFKTIFYIILQGFFMRNLFSYLNTLYSCWFSTKREVINTFPHVLLSL